MGIRTVDHMVVQVCMELKEVHMAMRAPIRRVRCGRLLGLLLAVRPRIKNKINRAWKLSSMPGTFLFRCLIVIRGASLDTLFLFLFCMGLLYTMFFPFSLSFSNTFSFLFLEWEMRFS